MTTQSQSRRRLPARRFGFKLALEWLLAMDGKYRRSQAFKRLSDEARKDMGLPRAEARHANPAHRPHW